MFIINIGVYNAKKRGVLNAKKRSVLNAKIGVNFYEMDPGVLYQNRSFSVLLGTLYKKVK